MGISEAEIENMKTRAREAGFGVDNAQADALRAAIADTADAQSDDIERILVEGQEVMIEATASEGERRNAQARLDSDVQDANREAERSGTRAGRVEITGLGSKDKERAQTDSRRRANNDARTQALLALQAQLDGWTAEAEKYRGLIDDFETRNFSKEQRDYFNSLPPEERFSAKDQAMQKLLAEGKIEPHEYDNWKSWHQKEAEANRKAAQVKEDLDTMKGQTRDTQERIAENTVEQHGALTAEAVSETLDDEQREIVDQAVDNDRIEGNDAQRNDFDSLLGGLGGLGGGPTSFANNAAPDTSLRNNAPPVQAEFKTVSTQTAEVSPDATFDPQVDRKADADGNAPANGMG